MSKFLSAVSVVSLRSSVLVLAALLAVVSMGCSESEEEEAKSEQVAAAVVPLDPTQAHYGKTYAEWAAEWWKWIYSLPGTNHPLLDSTGAHCAAGQENNTVFFLVGTGGGAVERTCSVPQGKAIFFPIINYIVDNGGVPVDKWLSDEEMQKLLKENVSNQDSAKLRANLDGADIPNLSKYLVSMSKFSYDIQPGDNLYKANGSDFSGNVDPAYTGGYWLLLPPLSKGVHKLTFHGESKTGTEIFVLDATYTLNVN